MPVVLSQNEGVRVIKAAPSLSKGSLNVACYAGFHCLRTGRRKLRHIGIIRYALSWMY